MKHGEKICVVLMILSTVGVLGGVLAGEHYRRARNFTVELTARAPEHGNWYPRTLRVPKGKEVKLFIRNIETVTHGFVIPDLNVAINQIKAGHVEVVTFVPERAGTFPFMCTVWCSPQHMEMTGKLIVE